MGDKLHAVVIDDGDFPEASHTLSVRERFERAIYMTHRHNIVSVWSDGGRSCGGNSAEKGAAEASLF